MTSAIDARRDAARQLAHLATHRRVDIDLVLDRPESLLILHRQALTARPDMCHRIDRLYAIAAGNADALHDHLHDDQGARP